MDQELEPIENRKTSRRLTASVKLHRVAGEFLSDVAETGASAAIASDPTRAMNSPSDLALLQVQDTLTALHKLAPSYRQLMPQRPTSALLPASGGITTANGSAFTSTGVFSTITATAEDIALPK